MPYNNQYQDQQQNYQQQNGQNQNQRKYYTNLTCYPYGVNEKTGANQAIIVCEVKPNRIDEPKTVATKNGDMTRINFSAPITNREQRISQALNGQMPDVKDNTIWARFTLFGKNAERFIKLVEANKNFYLTVSGKGSIYQSVGQTNGQTYNNLEITVDEFWGIRPAGEQKNQQGQNQNQAQNQRQTQQYNNNQQYQQAPQQNFQQRPANNNGYQQQASQQGYQPQYQQPVQQPMNGFMPINDEEGDEDMPF